MVRSLQPTVSFKSIEGPYSRDPHRLGHPCTISSDGRYIFSISDAAYTHDSPPLASATIHNKNGNLISAIKLPTLVNCGSLSGDGTVALAATETGHLHLWNALTGHSLIQKKSLETPFCDISLTPSADLFVSTSFNDDIVRLWDTANLRPIHQFPRVLEQPTRGGLISLQPDGRRVYICDYTRVHVLDCSMQKEAYSLSVSDMGVMGSFMSACATDRCGRTLAAVHWPPNQLCLWDIRMRKVRSKIRLRGNHGLGTVAITPDGGRVVVSTYAPEAEDRMAVVVDVGSQRVTHKLIHADARTISSDISADGRVIATLSKDGITRIFDLNGAPRRVFDKIDIGPPGSKIPLGSDVHRIYIDFMNNERALPCKDELLQALCRTERGHSIRGIKDIYCAHVLVRTVMANDNGMHKVHFSEGNDIEGLLWKSLYKKMPSAAGEYAGRRELARQIMHDAHNHGLLSDACFGKMKSLFKSLPGRKNTKADLRPLLKNIHARVKYDFKAVGSDLKQFKLVHEGKKSERLAGMATTLIPLVASTCWNEMAPTGAVLFSLDIESISAYLTEVMGFPIGMGTESGERANSATGIVKFVFSEKYMQKLPTRNDVNLRKRLEETILEGYQSLSVFRSELDRIY